MTFYALPLPKASPVPGSLDCPRKGRGTFFGFGFVDTILSLALVVILSLSAYGLFGPVTTASDVSLESQRLDALVKGVNATYVSGVDYAGLAQTPFAVPGFQSNTSAWGQPFSVLPTTIKVSNDAWVVTYQGTAADTCSRLGAVEWEKIHWYVIQIDGHAVASASALNGACTTPTGGVNLHEMQFINYNGTRPNASSGLAPLCWDRTREEVAAGHADPGCPTDPSLYLPGTLP